VGRKAVELERGRLLFREFSQAANQDENIGPEKIDKESKQHKKIKKPSSKRV